MSDLEQQLEELGHHLRHCPPAEEVARGRCFGVKLADMTRDQLMQIIWLLSQRRTGPTVIA